MLLSREEVIHVAALCRIAVSTEEVIVLRNQLSDILDQFTALAELDTVGVPPTTHSVAVSAVLRSDEPKASASQKSVLANAPRRQDNLFRVLPVLEEE
jgi:aspartyl-tRNA(Asn)/glutamyl-tRNA(Gln) amidotransferase subunit C